MICTPKKKLELRDLRERVGLSVSQVAISLGVSADSLRRWERKENTPSAEHLFMLCRLYGVNINWIATKADSFLTAT